MTNALTRRELDATTCAMPDCDHTAHHGLVLKARCHPQGHTAVEYRDGILTVTCAACARLVTRIAVKEAP